MSPAFLAELASLWKLERPTIAGFPEPTRSGLDWLRRKMIHEFCVAARGRPGFDEAKFRRDCGIGRVEYKRTKAEAAT